MLSKADIHIFDWAKSYNVFRICLYETSDDNISKWLFVSFVE